MDREIFEIEARRLRPILIRYVSSILHNDNESEDVVQESLLKLWFFRTKLDDYKSIDAVAHVIAGRLSINRVRDRKMNITLNEAWELTDESIRYSVEDYSDSTLRALESLPSVEQAVLKMKHIEGMETEEIASLISSNPAAVRVALSRARKKMRERFLSRQ